MYALPTLLGSNRRVSRFHGAATAWLVLACLSLTPVRAQVGENVARRGEEPDRLRVHLVTFQNQPAEEAMRFVLPLLSPYGSVEVQPGGNTLVIRDDLASLSRILPVLADFDHPRRSVEVTVLLLEAFQATVSPPGVFPSERLGTEVEGLSAILQTLRRHLPYANYELLSHQRVRTREGEFASMKLDEGFRIRFAVGTVLGDQRLRLNGFEVIREASQSRRESSSLLRSNLNLWLDRPAVVALSRPATAEGSASGGPTLLVVIRCETRPATPAEVP